MQDLDARRAANRARFAQLIAGPEHEIDLALGALLIAADGREALDPEPALATLDALATHVQGRVDPAHAREQVLDELHGVLYGELGFRGPGHAAGPDADHSRLDRVLERRIGLPICLAIIELEVAWRLDVPLHGVGLPGHFILGGPNDLLIDPADAGRRLTRDDCQALLRRSLGEGVLLDAGMLRPASRRQILARVLRNLRAAHLATRDWPAALRALELLAIVEPTTVDHDRDRGLLLGRLGRFTEAVTLLRRYLEERPDGHDRGDVRQVIGIFGGRRN
jgi:regulator of sirC expression with transglutaminase-like and TPR domain